MILCDTGPLVAILDHKDRHHERCRSLLRSLPPVPLLTTLPCWVEAMYLMYRLAGFPGQEKLWTLRNEDLVRVHISDQGELDRIQTLMKVYLDIPMDLADASLVALAESLRLDQIFTLDRHFFAYRQTGNRPFTVLPEGL